MTNEEVKNAIKNYISKDFGKRFREADLAEAPANERQREAYDLAQKYYDNKSLYIAGNYGTGKTRLLAGIYKSLLKTGKKTKVFMIKDLADWLRDAELNCDVSKSIKDLRRQYDVFILDDIDKVKLTETFDSNFFVFIDYLYQDEKIIHISANMNFDQLKQAGFNGGTIRRIQDISEIVKL
ncbi:MAG: ATP-binding protein [Elusimicrobiota bacterium]|jgi:DNA replication protein DnaC|nr:ATP-binding protein [Elusimicrobiota bacterium]